MSSAPQEIRHTFRYPLIFTINVFEPENTALRDVIAAGGDLPARAVFVVDRGVLRGRRGFEASIERYCRRHRDAMTLASPVIVMAGGERVKNDTRHVDRLHQVVNDVGLCRHSYFVAVGGGAVLDVIGYAAATAHRGVRLIRLPTTVLAQDDSGVGVKNGINAFGKKNFLGTFAPPFAVINDMAFLSTLSDRDVRSGVSEAVKVALIKDRPFFDYIEQNVAKIQARDRCVLEEVVKRSAVLHADHIAKGGDPFELGSSRPLDFGHWAAHKLEQLTRHRLRHGEAVAIGLALDSTYSYLIGSLAEDEWRRLLDLLETLHLPLTDDAVDQGISARHGTRPLLQGLEEFREHLGGRLTVMLLGGIGKAYDAHEIDNSVMIRSTRMLRERQRASTRRAPARRSRGLPS
jgi:3-dehydroquinate synthase